MARTLGESDVPNAVIGQSGGPTVVINQSLAAAVLEARKHRRIGRFYGARHGVRGILERNFVDLSSESKANLMRIAVTPAAALGSVRLKPTREDCAEMFRIMQSLRIGYFFYIGGNDSAETAAILHAMAHEQRYALRVFHIPKTIDNDLRETDHCPGYGSAAKFVAQAFMGDDLDNRSLPGVKINIVMGRHAGFLTAASVLGKSRPDSGPHLVYVPERAFNKERFVQDVHGTLARYGRCVVAASEGLQDENGEALAKGFSTEVDAHGNVQLSGTGGLGDFLAAQLRTEIGGGLRVRADTLGYMQRSFAGVVSDVDAHEAWRVGEEAVRQAARGVPSGSISIKRARGSRYRVTYECTALEKVAKVTRSLPASYINRAGNGVTAAFVNYARPLVGELPIVGFLKAKSVPKK